MLHMVSLSTTRYFQGPYSEERDMTGFQVGDFSCPPLKATEHDEEMQVYADENGHRQNDTTSSRSRIISNDDVLRPFLEDFTRATAQMKLLKEAALWCPLSWGRKYASDCESEEDEHEEDEWLPSVG
jgi:hypothetical protein